MIKHLKKREDFNDKKFLGVVVGSETKYTQYDINTLLREYDEENYISIEDDNLNWIYLPLDVLEYLVPHLKDDLEFKDFYNYLDKSSFYPLSIIL